MTALLLLAAWQDPEFEAAARPLLTAYCTTCHGGKKPKSGVDLSKTDLEKNPKPWLQAIAQLKTRAMPPDDAEKRPTDAEREKLLASLERAMDRIDERAPRDPGRPTIRRLNRAEYDNTVRDLVGLDLRPADDFPLDDVGEGFDTLGEILTLSPLLLEKYLDAAERILDRAMVAEGKIELLEKTIEGKELALEREHATTILVPADGRYEVRARAWQEGAPDGAATLVVRVDGVDTAVIAIRGEKAPYGATLPLQAGERRLAFRHTPPRALKKDEKPPPTRLHVEAFEIAGPERSLSHRRILFEADARKVIGRFAARAFRRPLEPAELDRLVALHDAAVREGRPFPAAVRRALLAVLISPHFLFRVERDSADGRLNDWEVASRLSYFLWSTMPDAALLDLAAQGRLREPAAVREQVRRMLADPRSRALADNFAGQWLGLRKLEHVHPDRDLFPGFTETLRAAMHDEVWLLFDGLVRGDRSLLELLHADYAWLNEPLARHYGIKGVQGEAMRRVALADPVRGGVITSAAILTITSHPTRTSAVKRGKWILDEILGAPPPPPPPNVPELEQATKDRPDAGTLALRQRMELHRADPQCHGCHKRMDVLGLGLENFDPLGRWREKDGPAKIDASGTLPAGGAFRGPGELKKHLASAPDEFARAVTEKLFVYALGRPLDRPDRREVKRAVEELRRSGWRVSALVEAVATSHPFLYRRPK